MRFIVATKDAERILCQFADMAPVEWIDARVAEAIGYSYAVRFETYGGAARSAFMNNGAVVALGDWDNDTEASRKVGRCRTCGHGEPPQPVAPERSASRTGESAARSGPIRGVPGRDAGAGSRSGADGRRAGTHAARLAPVVAADWRARQSDTRLIGDGDYVQLFGRARR